MKWPNTPKKVGKVGKVGNRLEKSEQFLQPPLKL
jgi:hypothetical protein